LKETLEKSNQILGKVQQGEGTLGALLNDPKTSQDVKDTVSNLKQTSESAKEVLARFTKVRAFWTIQAGRISRWSVQGDVGLRIETRPNKFMRSWASICLLMAARVRTTRIRADQYDYGLDRPSLGKLHGSGGDDQIPGGIEGRYRPFQNTEVPVLNRFELLAQGSDFGRDAIIKGRHFTHPNYSAGARVKINQWITAGVTSDDIAETANIHGALNVAFEDKDVAYLLGFTTFAR